MLNNIKLCDQLTSVSYILHDKCPENKTSFLVAVQ